MRSETRHRHVRVLFAITVFTVTLTSMAWGVTYTAIDLNPSGFDYSCAYGTSGTQQAGSGTMAGEEHALLWNGSAASCVDLNPSGFYSSAVYGSGGTQQVGWGAGLSTGGYHALLWNGSAASYVDLDPTGRFIMSNALGTSGTQQVGWGMGYDGGHALLWNGSAASYVDLNPSGFDWSEARGIIGTQQVGGGYGSATGGQGHALLWNGTADSYIDLHQFLPDGFTDSFARAIDSSGNIVGNATDSSGYQHAILWEIPEPTTLLLLGLGGLTVLRRRK